LIKSNGDIVMKKIIKLTWLLLFALSSSVFANGTYDGIYAVNVGGEIVEYVSIHENSGNIIAVVISADPSDSWVALSGALVGSKAVMNSIAGADVKLGATVNFSGTDTSTAVINYCNDGINYACKFPSGMTLNLNRIF